jgi:Flp pilus assembly pilin Flp
MKRHFVRRGISTVQWVVIAALITLSIVAGVSVLGGRTSIKLNETATDVADPHELTHRFGS